MTTLPADAPVPDALACRLAGHYARNAREPLAVFYWTGRVLPGTAAQVERRIDVLPDTDSRDRKDDHAIIAELRALAWYCRTNEGRHDVPDWRDARTAGEGDPWRQWWIDYELVVPWAWKGPSA